jgi:hypothetical protein
VVHLECGGGADPALKLYSHYEVKDIHMSLVEFQAHTSHPALWVSKTNCELFAVLLVVRANALTGAESLFH